MRNIYFIVIISLFIISCEGKKEHYYDASFPKRYVSLSEIIGKEIILKTKVDTQNLIINDKNGLCLIINNINKDTVFYGKVSKYRGLYFLSEQISSEKFEIYGIKIEDSLLYGLGYLPEQPYIVDKIIKSGRYKQLVVDFKDSIYRLHPYKRFMKKLYREILNEKPDTILNYKKSTNMITNIVSEIKDKEEFEYLSKVYPNPTKDFIEIELQINDSLECFIYDNLGRVMYQDKFYGYYKKINLITFQKGIYFLNILNPKSNQRETIKIIKQ